MQGRKTKPMIKELYLWMLYKILCWICPEEPELDEHENALGE